MAHGDLVPDDHAARRWLTLEFKSTRHESPANFTALVCSPFKFVLTFSATPSQKSGPTAKMGKSKGPSKMIYLYGLLPCAGGLGFGYDTGSMSGILAMPQFLNYMGNPGNFL